MFSIKTIVFIGIFFFLDFYFCVILSNMFRNRESRIIICSADIAGDKDSPADIYKRHKLEPPEI